MKKTDKLAAKVLKDIMYPDPYSYGWPPTCMGLFYQPERPVAAVRKESHSEPDRKE